MKKNIGIVTAWFAAGGGFVSKQYEMALSTQHNVFVYARATVYSGTGLPIGNPDWDHDNVIWGKKHYRSGGINKRHFLKWIRDKKIDVIIFNEQRFYPAIIWAKEAGVVCGAYVDYYTQRTVSWFSLYDFLICNTRRHFSVFEWHPKAYYIPWGVEPEILNRKIEWAQRPLTFIASAGWSTANDEDRRGAYRALCAFLNVKGACRFRLYSQNPIEKMTMLWRNIIKADSRIEVIVGTFSPFPYEDGDVYVYPSRLDGIGLTLPEAIASGLPAITTDNAPMNEFVIDDVNGKLVRVDRFLGRHDGYYWAESLCSIQSLASAMQFYIDNPEVLSKHRIGAKEFAKRNFDWMAHAPELCRIVSEATQMGPISSLVRLEIEKEFRNPFMQYLVDTKRFLEKLKFLCAL